MKTVLMSLGLRSALALMALSLFCALPTFAAAQTASIAGTVTDSSGAVIEGAEISARNTATNESHGATSSDTGAFSIPNLQIGPYEVTVKKEGFKAFHQSSLELTVAQVLTVNATLSPGAISEEVTVSRTARRMWIGKRRSSATWWTRVKWQACPSSQEIRINSCCYRRELRKLIAAPVASP